jgi:hypothetical protein
VLFRSVEEIHLYFGLPNPQVDFFNLGYSWETFQKYTQNETHSLFKDPQFRTPSKGDYQLSPKSPARGAGIPLGRTVERDMVGNIRKFQPGPTLGAWE